MLMKVILKEDVEHLGKLGDLVNVKPGYGRNYLIPQGLAVSATVGNVRQIEHQKKLIAAAASARRGAAQSLASRIEHAKLVINAQAGAEGRLFGSVTNRDVEEALLKAGITIDRKQIVLTDAVKAVGEHTAMVKLGHEVEAKVKFTVVANA